MITEEKIKPRKHKKRYAWHRWLPGLHRQRKAADLSVRELARLAGVAPASVHQLETLQRTARPATRQALARALRCKVGKLTKPPEEENRK